MTDALIKELRELQMELIGRYPALSPQHAHALEQTIQLLSAPGDAERERLVDKVTALAAGGLERRIAQDTLSPDDYLRIAQLLCRPVAPVVTDEMVALKETCKTLSAAAEASIADMVLSAANGFRTAIVLANNFCVQVSDGHNADDQTEEAAAASECARRIRGYVEASDQTIIELMEEAGYPVASQPGPALSQPAGGGK